MARQTMCPIYGKIKGYYDKVVLCLCCFEKLSTYIYDVQDYKLEREKLQDMEIYHVGHVRIILLPIFPILDFLFFGRFM